MVDFSTLKQATVAPSAKIQACDTQQPFASMVSDIVSYEDSLLAMKMLAKRGVGELEEALTGVEETLRSVIRKAGKSGDETQTLVQEYIESISRLPDVAKEMAKQTVDFFSIKHNTKFTSDKVKPREVDLATGIRAAENGLLAMKMLEQSGMAGLGVPMTGVETTLRNALQKAGKGPLQAQLLVQEYMDSIHHILDIPVPGRAAIS